MSRHIPRLYCRQPLAEGNSIRLDEDVSHHLLRVLRLSAGSAVVLFDGRGGEHTAEISTCGKNWAELRVGPHRDVCRESPLSITLAQGISRGERMDYSIQKAVELGVAAIQPLETERSVVRISGERLERKQAHWQEIARSAAEQCGRDRVPPVAGTRTFEEWLAAGQFSGTRLLLAPEAGAHLREQAASEKVCLLIGPEGGFSDTEESQAQRAGFLAVSLGPRVLRTETATVAALATLQALWGDLTN